MPPIISSPSRARHGNINESLGELFRRSQKRFYKPMKLSTNFSRPSLRDAPQATQNIPSELTCDSRRVGEGSLFFLPWAGPSFDGAKFIPEAIARGACAVVSDQPIGRSRFRLLRSAPSARRWPGRAEDFWGMPEKKLTLVGLTGTAKAKPPPLSGALFARETTRRLRTLSTIEYDLGNRPSGLSHDPDSLDIYSYPRPNARRGA
jgi:UDP-N-acetylmuramyl tripeptide synthase